MNLFRKLFLRLSDPLLKQCLWHRSYNLNTGTSTSPAWLNKLMYCDCAYTAQAYQSSDSNYTHYLWKHSFLSCIEKRQRQRSIKYWSYQPLISIQLAVFKVDIGQLHACLDSVARQLYPHWQLCIIEDGSQMPTIRETLTAFKNRFPEQVKLVFRDDNQGITATSQEAFMLSEGEYIALLDHDDYLAPEALYEVVKLLNQQPDTDWIYSDNDKLDSSGLRCCLHAKPAWSPELLLTYNYILHLSVIRRSLIERAGGFRAGFEGSQDHDLYLRLAELSSKIKHIPRVLYSWRQSADSVALNPENKSYAYDAALRALNAALVRRGENGLASHPKHSWLGSYQIIRVIEQPSIDVILLSTENTELPILNSLKRQSGIAITSQSWLTQAENAGNELQALINKCQSTYVLLLSPLVEFTDAQQLFNLATHLAPSGIALSTAKINHQNNQVDHCGLAYQQGLLRYPLRGWAKDLDGMGAYGALPRNISLSSPLINLIKTTTLQQVLDNLSNYTSVAAWFLALAFELKNLQQRLVVDGGISLLYTPTEPYQLTLPDLDKALLQHNYPVFFTTDDSLYHQQM
ncbi:MAG: glycosyltransferase [Methylococcaceae bacterium]|nr:glycosyltransferase [Methylococcaceae bacterium]